MCHEHEVSRHIGNRRILELVPAAGEPGDIAKRVNHNGRGTRSEAECGLAVPLNLHVASVCQPLHRAVIPPSISRIYAAESPSQRCPLPERPFSGLPLPLPLPLPEFKSLRLALTWPVPIESSRASTQASASAQPE